MLTNVNQPHQHLLRLLAYNRSLERVSGGYEEYPYVFTKRRWFLLDIPDAFVRFWFGSFHRKQRAFGSFLSASAVQ